MVCFYTEFTDDDWKLLLIKQRMEVGCVMDEHKIYKVNKIVMLPLSDAEPQELDLDVRILFMCCK